MTRAVLRAIVKDNFDGLDKLLEEGADILETTPCENWNYLHRSLCLLSFHTSPEMIQILIDRGVGVDQVDNYGNTPLLYACRRKSYGVIKVLIDAGANVNQICAEGLTPLRQLFSVKPFDYDCTKLLIDSGADIHQKGSGSTIKELVETVCFDRPDILTLFNQ